VPRSVRSPPAPKHATQARHQIVTLTANCGRSTGVPFVPPCLASLPPTSYPFDGARYQRLAFPIIENQTDMGQKVIGPP
jgi:hypothetical protein